MIFSGANTDEIFGVHRSELRPLEASDRSTGLQAGPAAIYCGAHSLLGLGLAGGHSYGELPVRGSFGQGFCDATCDGSESGIG